MGRIGMLAPVLAALAAACASAGAGDGATPAQSIPPAGKLPFTIGSETTVITKPVGPDGLPDYLAALNAEYSKGVTPDSNAFLLLARAFGPTFFDEKLLPSYCRALGIERFEFLDDCWAPLPDAKPFELAQQAACERPWKPDEHPKLYGWLRRNEDALKLIVAASDRPRYYMPLVCSPTSKAPFRVSGALIRSVAKCQAAARALAARANLRLSGGDAAGAWADVRAIYPPATMRSWRSCAAEPCPRSTCGRSCANCRPAGRREPSGGRWIAGIVTSCWMWSCGSRGSRGFWTTSWQRAIGPRRNGLAWSSGCGTIAQPLIGTPCCGGAIAGTTPACGT